MAIQKKNKMEGEREREREENEYTSLRPKEKEI
jgi:hypothetical protein